MQTLHLPERCGAQALRCCAQTPLRHWRLQNPRRVWYATSSNRQPSVATEAIVSRYDTLAQERTLRQGRRRMEEKHPLVNFPMAGVTFDGRQELVRELQPDQIVVIEREPWNTYDPTAVRVTDLRGRTLGYVPRRDGFNTRFANEGAFGLVASTGNPKDSHNCGALIYARPDLPNLLLDPTEFVDLPSYFRKRWNVLRVTTLATSRYMCEVTGLLKGKAPLEVVAQWRYNEHDKAVQLTRLMALSSPLMAAKSCLEKSILALLEEEPGTAAAELRKLQSTADGQLFTEINGLGDADAVQYFEYVLRRAKALKAESWKVEVLL